MNYKNRVDAACRAAHEAAKTWEFVRQELAFVLLAADVENKREREGNRRKGERMMLITVAENAMQEGIKAIKLIKEIQKANTLAIKIP